MKECAFNLLTTPSFHTEPNAITTLPGLLALLARDQVDSYPALRPHQAPAWHMFLVQLAALAMHRAELSELPDTEAEWARILRGLTAEFPGDEPWCLVVEDRSKPAFMQPPVPQGVKLDTEVATPDALDLLITSRNHDLKQAVARFASPEDWIFALVSLQTMAPSGGGQGGYRSITRIKSGWSYRPFVGLAPLLPESKGISPRLGIHFQRDVNVLLATRDDPLLKHDAYKVCGGLALVWTAPWEESRPLQLGDLDIWFVEVCRRIRFGLDDQNLVCRKGTARGARINAELSKGNIGDPWAPVNKTENEMLTLGPSKQQIDYRLVVDIFMKPENWLVPLLAQHTVIDGDAETFALIIRAFSHDKKGNSTGFKSRILPIGGKISRALGPRRIEIHELAQQQIVVIEKFETMLSCWLALATGSGNIELADKFEMALKRWLASVDAGGWEKMPHFRLPKTKKFEEYYARTDETRMRLDCAVDEIFFEHLWARFEAQDAGQEAKQAESLRFVRQLYELAQSVFEEALPAMPCAKLFRPRAEVRARRAFHSSIRSAFPELILVRGSEETNDANS